MRASQVLQSPVAVRVCLMAARLYCIDRVVGNRGGTGGRIALGSTSYAPIITIDMYGFLALKLTYKLNCPKSPKINFRYFPK